MPLIINGVVMDKLHSDTRTLLDSYPSLKEYSRRLLSQSPKAIGPIGSLCVVQREYAVVSPNDQYITFLGTDMVTTCSTVILRHSGTGIVALGHFDGSGREAAKSMISKAQELSSQVDVHGELELHLIGGFMDSRGYSTDLCLQILYCFHRQPVNVHLITACVCELNNMVRGNINLPVITGCAVNVKTGDIFPAIFQDRGPDVPLRMSRLLAPGSPEMLDIYETLLGLLKIGPFYYQPVRGIDACLELGDDLILKYLSTAPEAEGREFVPTLRSALAFIQKHPFPNVTVFGDGRPRYYRKDEYGQWIPIP